MSERLITLDNGILLVNDNHAKFKGDKYLWISHDEKRIIKKKEAIALMAESIPNFFSNYKKINIEWCHIQDGKDLYLVTLIEDFNK